MEKLHCESGQENWKIPDDASKEIIKNARNGMKVMNPNFFQKLKYRLLNSIIFKTVNDKKNAKFDKDISKAVKKELKKIKGY